ncbi:zinc metalloproteinase nas-4-like isoform X4 [Bradysia coprophila]|uniref:zinc metalloproteinase nas-4-like isoform X4 n=1 Tax=Bradysia coprophila TaxID=38358 RepID=UPI00187DA045|nr:zinc metalloproteinase nas-4-like isoform X4 [Bradysia coprophila]
MDSQLKVIFVCFIVNSIIVCNVSTVDANVLDNSVYYHENDVSKMSSKDIYNLHHGFVEEVFKWKDGQINFKIDKNFNDYEIDKILAAMYEIERSSCIRFTAHDSSDGPDYVMIKKDYTNRFSASSDLGYCHWGEQLIELTPGSLDEHTTILRQLLHTIGFDHHHRRSDRDIYITIHLENTNLSESSILANYVQLIRFDPLVKYLTPFDFDSVLLFSEHDFSINSEPVITSKKKGARIPSPVDRNRGLSNYDVILLNRFYDCQNVDRAKSKIFYENDIEILYPWVVNYHEIQLAKEYIEKNEPQDVEENQIYELSDGVHDPNFTINEVDEIDSKHGYKEESQQTDNCNMCRIPIQTKKQLHQEDNQIDGQLHGAKDANLTNNRNGSCWWET